MGRKSRIRNDSNEGGFSKRAGSPSQIGIASKPNLHLLVRLVAGPCKRDQHVYIQQKRRHSNSDSSSFTRLLVIRRESRGTSNTWIPFTVCVDVGEANPLRTSSDTALPKAKERLSA